MVLHTVFCDYECNIHVHSKVRYSVTLQNSHIVHRLASINCTNKVPKAIYL